ncbi:hypothetical protein D3C85_628420 [compost metagenome]
MDVNDNACFLNKRVALGFIASTRASIGCSYNCGLTREDRLTVLQYAPQLAAANIRSRTE